MTVLAGYRSSELMRIYVGIVSANANGACRRRTVKVRWWCRIFALPMTGTALAAAVAHLHNIVHVQCCVDKVASSVNHQTMATAAVIASMVAGRIRMTVLTLLRVLSLRTRLDTQQKCNMNNDSVCPGHYCSMLPAENSWIRRGFLNSPEIQSVRLLPGVLDLKEGSAS